MLIYSVYEFGCITSNENDSIAQNIVFSVNNYNLNK